MINFSSIWELVLVVTSALIAFVIARGKREGSTKAGMITSLAVSIGLVLANGWIWSATGKGIVEHVTCAALPDSTSCRAEEKVLISDDHYGASDEALWSRCTGTDPVLVISGCSAFIGSSLEDKITKHSAYFNRGRARHELGDFDMAIADYSAAIEFDPGQANAWNARGSALARKGDFPAALKDYEAALRLEPRNAGFLYNVAMNYRDMRQPERAMSYYDRAVGIDPSRAEPYAGRGALHFRLGHLDAAIADYDAAIERGLKAPYVYLIRGEAYLKKKDYRKAHADFDAAIAKNRANSVAWSDRGLAFYEERKLDEAIASFDTAISYDRHNAYAYMNRANAYDLRAGTPDFRGDFKRAQADYAKAIELRPALALAYYNRGLSNGRRGNDQAANPDFDTAERLDATLKRPDSIANAW